MKKRVLLFGIFYFLTLGFLSYRLTFAFFKDTATSTNNVFTASSNFGSQPPVGIADHVMISEVQIATGSGTAGTESDFIELYNPTGSSISLDPYKLVMRTSTGTSDVDVKSFTSSHIIPAHGFFLWAHKDDSNNYAGSISANVFSTDTLASNNSVALKLASNSATIDALSWSFNLSALQEGSRFTNSTPSAGQSIERKALSTSTVSSMEIGGPDEFKGNGFDSDNNSSDFILRATSQPQNSSSSTETP